MDNNIRADEMTSRRTNVSGRTLLTASSAVFFSSIFNWNLTALWGLSKAAHIDQNELNLVGVIVLIFLMFTHFTNWWPDFIGTILMSRGYAKAIDTWKEKKRLLEIAPVQNDKSITNGDIMHDKDASAENGLNAQKHSEDLKEAKYQEKYFRSSLWSIYLQVFGLHLILPLATGVLGVTALIYRIVQINHTC